MSLLTAWQFMVELGHNVPNPLQPNQHEQVPLEGKTVLVNGAAAAWDISQFNWRSGRARE
jgi:NADPH:quinone reductase-like Zn-dependent oxidoreductase